VRVVMMAVVAMSQHQFQKNNAAFIASQRSIVEYGGHFFDAHDLNFA
jgi:hypothetical protein